MWYYLFETFNEYNNCVFGRTGRKGFKESGAAGLRQIRKIIPIIICSLGCLLLTGCERDIEDVPTGDLRSFVYHPGYGDMDGGYHVNSLEKDERGEWMIISRNRDSFGEPDIVTVYAVSPEDVHSFEAFLKEKKISSLADRRDSDFFVTDYSPWYYSVTFDSLSEGDSKHESYDIYEYKEYSDKDRKLIDEMRIRFNDLKGKVISETVETEDGDDVRPGKF